MSTRLLPQEHGAHFSVGRNPVQDRRAALLGRELPAAVGRAAAGAGPAPAGAALPAQAGRPRAGRAQASHGVSQARPRAARRAAGRGEGTPRESGRGRRESGRAAPHGHGRPGGRARPGARAVLRRPVDTEDVRRRGLSAPGQQALLGGGARRAGRPGTAARGPAPARLAGYAGMMFVPGGLPADVLTIAVRIQLGAGDRLRASRGADSCGAGGDCAEVFLEVRDDNPRARGCTAARVRGDRRAPWLLPAVKRRRDRDAEGSAAVSDRRATGARHRDVLRRDRRGIVRGRCSPTRWHRPWMSTPGSAAWFPKSPAERTWRRWSRSSGRVRGGRSDARRHRRDRGDSRSRPGRRTHGRRGAAKACASPWASRSTASITSSRTWPWTCSSTALPAPCLALLVSGGHTSLLLVRDVVGDVDCSARRSTTRRARPSTRSPGYWACPTRRPADRPRCCGGDPAAIRFPRAKLHDGTLRLLVRRAEDSSRAVGGGPPRRGEPVPVADVAATFQEAVADVLTRKAVAACREQGVTDLVLGGGVAANSRLRALAAERCAEAGIRLRVPARPVHRQRRDGGRAGRVRGRGGRPPSTLSLPADSSLPVTEVLVPQFPALARGARRPAALGLLAAGAPEDDGMAAPAGGDRDGALQDRDDHELNAFSDSSCLTTGAAGLAAAGRSAPARPAPGPAPAAASPRPRLVGRGSSVPRRQCPAGAVSAVIIASRFAANCGMSLPLTSGSRERPNWAAAGDVQRGVDGHHRLAVPSPGVRVAVTLAEAVPAPGSPCRWPRSRSCGFPGPSR